MKTDMIKIRAGVLTAVTTPLRLLALIVVAGEAMLGLALGLTEPRARPGIFCAMLVLLTVVIVALLMIVLKAGARGSTATRQPADLARETRPTPTTRVETNRDPQSQGILAENAPPLSPDARTLKIRDLCSLLHQAARYSTPAYYLDTSLNIIDWNVSFELIFRDILERIKGRHVNFFIAQLSNADEVFDHGREFTRKHRAGELPLIDIEPLTYRSGPYGLVSFTKVACQLTDGEADLKAWAVSLLITDIDWTSFLADLQDHLRQDKLWSIYAVSYDAVLLRFPAYSQLIETVLSGIPRTATRVLDLGAGTGNVTRALLRREPTARITAVENNHEMIARMLAKRLDRTGRVDFRIAAARDLSAFPAASHDAAVAVNVLYALEDPLRCMREIGRILKPGGAFAFSTTHTDTNLTQLLEALGRDLGKSSQFRSLEPHYRRVCEINRDIEVNLARRYSRDQYLVWLAEADFEIVKHIPSVYEDALMVVHARKR
jgi:ubiquinone/menaquinone biosynthesis C-methylase UbiE